MRPPSQSKKRIESLYVLKAVCAFFVVSIHVHMYMPHNILLPIAGIGTPIFLAITGYLLYSNDYEREEKKCIAWSIKCFWLAVSINLIYAIAAYFFNKNAIPPFNLAQCIKLFILGTGISGSFLWYLSAICQALLLMWLIIRFSPKIINFLPLLFIGIIIMRQLEINPAFQQYHLLTLRNTCIVTSLPCLATGYLLHKYETKILNAINVHVWLITAIVLLFVEYQARMTYGITCNYVYLTTYPLVVLIMLTCIKHQDFSLPILGTIGKHHSPNIYYFHGLFIWIFAEMNKPSCDSIFPTAIIYCACIPVSFLFNYIRKLWITHAWKPLLHAWSTTSD